MGTLAEFLEQQRKAKADYQAEYAAAEADLIRQAEALGPEMLDFAKALLRVAAFQRRS